MGIRDVIVGVLKDGDIIVDRFVVGISDVINDGVVIVVINDVTVGLPAAVAILTKGSKVKGISVISGCLIRDHS